MPDDFRLQVRSDPRFLRCVRNLVRGWVEISDLEPNATDEMVLAIDEACSNAMRHAYGGNRDRWVELTLRADEAYLEVRLCDQGEPCPSEFVQRRELEVPDPEDLTPGGLGVQLMHRAFDEVEFCPDRTQGNCVIMRRKRKQ
ncbi:MAG: ATP-binding protein [Acidobacteriota bacterium]|nr:ATP-binding protein [Acidobacteriota bacterium]